MKINVKFQEDGKSFNVHFGEVHNISDGGYKRGYAEGYENGSTEILSKLTTLSVTENGEYIPPSESVGFDRVTVNVANKMLQIIDRSVTEITESDLYGITSIGGYSFHSCQKITSISIPKSVITIGGFAFYNCYLLKSIVIPDGVQTIEAQTFSGCIGLEEITLSKKMSNINYTAFRSNWKLKVIRVRATEPPTLTGKLSTNAPALEQIIVPIGSGEAYKAATNWSADADLIIEGNV